MACADGGAGGWAQALKASTEMARANRIILADTASALREGQTVLHRLSPDLSMHFRGPGDRGDLRAQGGEAAGNGQFAGERCV